MYILRSEKDGKRYIGCTQDLAKRVACHGEGRVHPTRARGPFSFVHVEQFGERSEAFGREKFFKSWGGRIELEKILSSKEQQTR